MFAFEHDAFGMTRCDGSLLKLHENMPLFALMHANYGGNGMQTIGVPDLRGRTVTGGLPNPGAPGDARFRYLVAGANTGPSGPIAFPRPGTIGIFPSNRDAPPSGWHFADGTLLPIRGNERLFEAIGAVFGGDGKIDFALPDLDASVPLCAGVHDFTPGKRLPGVDGTSVSALILHAYICVDQGVFPTEEGTGAMPEAEPVLGQIVWSAAPFEDARWLPCEGQLLSAHVYERLHALIGNRFGGDGQPWFALPDLRGRTIKGD
ncbi:tail fiber protein [Sphingomonas sp. AOB5]|uniref:tail fiber protein n=1 Tax=Sphingomonas sp. AOB5 TaxID=3034017 RepID=UPI0023F8CDDE|nr:tail fiber protein [Sphingomonas sp. AOB5]MDF7777216.1 tail fiber protein [Sphingomonas sp. AOB5]